MYAIFKQLHRHTGVETSVVCNFYNNHEEHLLVSSVNYLDVYQISENDDHNNVFDHVQSFRFSGNITSMQTVKFGGISDRDCLALAFPDSKISIVCYDEDTHDLKTLSLNYFEDIDHASGIARNSFPPQIRVDPQHRCIGGLFYGKLISIIPLRCEISKLRRSHLTEEGLDMGKTFSVSLGPQKGSDISSIDGRLASYCIDVSKLPNVPMIHVHDIQFLQGYFEPTLLILGESHRNWVGRLACRVDSCVVAAVSLTADLEDTAAHSNTAGQFLSPPVIWYVEGLPFDSFKLLPIPRPIGGALLFCNNSLLYLNQSVPLFGVAVNVIGERTTNLTAVKPSVNQPDLAITLDCCQAAFIGPQDDRTVLLSLSNGDLYILTLIADSMRFMRTFRFDKAGASVLSTCVSMLKPNMVFLGSRLGNSLLLRYRTSEPGDATKPFEPDSKKRKIDQMQSSQVDDLDLLLFDEKIDGDAKALGEEEAVTYHFEVCSSLTTTGPCSQAVVAPASGLSDEFSGNNKDPELELIVSAGHGRNGAACMMQRHIRPQIVTGFSLPGCVDMWTVTSAYRPIGAEESPEMHSFLLVSRSDSTLVLETGQEIAEVDDTRGFSTIFSTVFASSLGKGRFILQVTSTSALLVDGQKEISSVSFGDNKTIVQASSADPYLVALASDGSVSLVELIEQEQGQPILTLIKCELPSDVTSVVCFEDKTGIASFLVNGSVSQNRELESPTLVDDGHVPTIKSETKIPMAPIPTDIDDEDLLLYGESSTTTTATTTSKPKGDSKEEVKGEPKTDKAVSKTYIGFVRSNGCLQLLSLPDMKLAFQCHQFGDGPNVLIHSTEDNNKDGSPTGDFPLPTISELCFVNIDAVRKHLYLFAATANNRIYIYECYTFGGQRDRARFARVPNEVLLLDLSRVRRTALWQPMLNQSTSRPSGGVAKEDEPAANVKTVLTRRSALFRPFDNIAGYSGVVICGPRPHWLMMNKHRPYLRCHPMVVEGNVHCLAEFHNPNCERGFVYYNAESELRIAVLSTHVDYTDVWPTRRIPLKATVHFMCSIPSQQLFAVIYSETTEKLTKIVHWETEEKQIVPLDRENRFVWPSAKKYTLQLYTSNGWDAAPAGRYEFDDWEQVTCMKVARLKGETQATSTTELISIGTNYSYGEDVLSRGRIMIFDVADVVPEPGQPLTRYRLKKISSREEKGPVTSMAVVSGSLLVSIGQRVYMFALKESSDLLPVSFIDSRLYNIAASGLKNFALLGDIQKSITLLRYQEDHKILSLVSRDFRPMPLMGVDFLVDNTQLGFIATDIDNNLIIFTHQPESRESFGANRLIPKADINLGSRINTMLRVRCRLGPLRKDPRFSQQYDHRHVTYLPTLDGGIGMLLPIKEQLYRRLLMLQVNF